MGVVVTDARRLSPQAQEDLRRRVVAAVEAGRIQVAVRLCWGVAAVGVAVDDRVSRQRQSGAESRETWSASG